MFWFGATPGGGDYSCWLAGWLADSLLPNRAQKAQETIRRTGAPTLGQLPEGICAARWTVLLSCLLSYVPEHFEKDSAGRTA